ncbi:MAG: amidohydrolase [Candidatus Acidiferrales bacterium]
MQSRASVVGKRWGILVCLTAFGLVTLRAAPACPDAPFSGVWATLILHSGKIITVDRNDDVVEAVAIRDGRILAVGTDREVLRLQGPGTQVIDLHGRTVIPGFIDSHSHPTLDGLKIFQPDLSKAASLAEIIQIMAAKVRETPSGQWVMNSGIWNESKLVEKRNPTRWDLDPISPHNPVFLNRGHLAVVNSEALRVLGIHEDTPNPPGGTYEKDPETGKLTGRLYEKAIDGVRAAQPELTRDQLMAVERQALNDLAAAGVTSVRSAADSQSAMRAYIALHNRGELILRTSVNILLNPNLPAPELEKMLRDAPVSSGLGDGMLSVWGIKFVADGGSDLAFLRKDYVNRPGFRGQPGATQENLTNAVRLCNRYGWRVGVHVVGDAAVDMVLNAFEAADKDDPIAGKRWALEHGYILHPEQMDKLKQLGIIMHMQSWHLYNLRRNFLQNYGPEYAAMSHPYRELINRGIPILGGTDWYLEPNDNFKWMWVEITRKTIDGEVVGLDQALTRQESLRFHTIWAAYSTFEENVKGSLEPGKFADLVVLSADYLKVPVDQIKEIRPVLTMVGGNVVFKTDASIMP